MWGSRETKRSFLWRAEWLQEGGEHTKRKRVVSGQDKYFQPKVGQQSGEGRPDSEAPGNRCESAGAGTWDPRM